MPSTWDEIQKENDDMRRQAVSDWKERVLRVEEPFIKTKEQKEAEETKRIEENRQRYIKWAHENPEKHLQDLAKELDEEMFLLMNKRPYVPSMPKGVPGYWDFRWQHGHHWIRETRERLPNE